MKKIFLVLLATLIVLPFASDACAKDKKKKKKKGETELVVSAPKKLSAYEKLFKGKNVVTAKSDFITLHKVENKLYFEIPLKYMNRDFLLASTVTKVTSPEFCDIGYKANEPMHLKFTKRDSTIFLRQVTASVTTDNLQKAMNSVYGDPILYAYEVKAYNPDSSAVVIDMTTLFTTNVKELGFMSDASMGGMIKVSSSFKKDASYLDEIKAFDDNLSVKTVMSYSVSMNIMGMMSLVEDYPFTATVTRSILLLPEQAMRPRLSDSRVGIFNSTKTRLSVTEQDEIANYSVAHRWRLEPKDVEAYKQGELVEPVKLDCGFIPFRCVNSHGLSAVRYILMEFILSFSIHFSGKLYPMDMFLTPKEDASMRNLSEIWVVAFVVTFGTSVTCPAPVHALSTFLWYVCPTNAGSISELYMES